MLKTGVRLQGTIYKVPEIILEICRKSLNKVLRQLYIFIIDNRPERS